MLLSGFLALALGAASPTPAMEISPGVKDVVAKYGKEFGPEAERELELLSASGDASAAALLGEILMFPNRAGGPDYSRSCDYSEKASEFASAVHNLGTCYFAGTGRAKDFAKARELYSRAADLGMAKSKCALGNMLVHGEGGLADPERGIELCKQGADAGDTDAQTDYGGYLLTGRYMPKNAVAARRYLSSAAAKGHRNAAFLLGKIYWNGDGTDKNVAEAAKWWEVALNGGRMDAAYLLASATMVQKIAPELKNGGAVSAAALEEARRWFGIAAEKDPDPEKRRKSAEMLATLRDLSTRPH